MDDTKSPPSKNEMLAQIRETRANLQAVLDTLSNEQITTPNVQGEWSVKDMLAHISAWERLAMDRLDAGFNNREPGYNRIQNDADVDEFNASVYDRNKGRPLFEVWAEFDASHKAFLKVIEALDEETFAGNIPAAWGQDIEVWKLIGANTCWHYPEHSEAIEAWLEETGDE